MKPYNRHNIITLYLLYSIFKFTVGTKKIDYQNFIIENPRQTRTKHTCPMALSKEKKWGFICIFEI